MPSNQKNMSKESTTYEAAGVSIDAGNELVKRIKPLVRATARAGAEGDIGGFGGLFDLAKAGYKDPILVSATDGVGTKLKIAQETGRHDTIGIDLVAMCVNDLIVQGTEPLFFLDYFATGKLDIDAAEAVVRGIAEGCKQAGCALIGGETAEMPGMYGDGEYDLAGFAVGAVERDALLPRKDINSGDLLIGLSSSGLHSNGFSLARHVIDSNNLKYNDIPDGFTQSIGETLLTPTKIYVKECLKLVQAGLIKAMAHITGGGLVENIPRVLPDGSKFKLNKNSWQMPYIFQWLQTQGNVTDNEMMRVFNCGIGMVLVVAPDQQTEVENLLEGSTVIGRIYRAL